jgi:hypothetical protein
MKIYSISSFPYFFINYVTHTTYFLTTGALGSAAMFDNSEQGRRIRTLIQNQDCVAIEVQYHLRCKTQYIQSIKKNQQSLWVNIWSVESIPVEQNID